MGIANTYYHHVVAGLTIHLANQERVPDAALSIDKSDFKMTVDGKEVYLGRIFVDFVYNDSVSNHKVYIVDGSEYDYCYYIASDDYATLVKFLNTYGYGADKVREIELGLEIECTQ